MSKDLIPSSKLLHGHTNEAILIFQRPYNTPNCTPKERRTVRMYLYFRILPVVFNSKINTGQPNTLHKMDILLLSDMERGCEMGHISRLVIGNRVWHSLR